MTDKTFDLTENELSAAMTFVKACLANMGGDRPADLEDDECTWVDANDLITSGWTKHEAAGTMSALASKAVIFEHEPGEWVLETAAWRWLDTVWQQ